MYKSISHCFLVLFSVFIVAESFAEPSPLKGYSTFNREDTTLNYTLSSTTVRAFGKSTILPQRAFAVGTNVVRGDSAVVQRIKSLSLAELIKTQSSIHIKEYGRGMVSHISVRGTSSSHTSISWNGINLALPTLGQANLSQIPLYFFDRVELHAGGSSLLYGDGAIGGAVKLSTVPLWKRGFSGDLMLSGGSFGTKYGAGTFRYSQGNFESRTSLFYSTAKNNYTFHNNTKPGLPKERLNNSSYKNMGVLQEIYKKFKDSSLLSASFWLLDYDRDIQPSVALNDRPQSHSSILDRSLKGTLGYSASLKKLVYMVKSSYSHDYQLYKGDVIEATKLSATAQAEYSLAHFIFRGGLSFEHTTPSAGSFAQSVKESRSYIYGVMRYSPGYYGKLLISVGLRAGEVTNGEVPVMPSLELRYSPIKSRGDNLSIRGALSRNSRVPTLNDRYWGGTHTWLKSENSFSMEGGADYLWLRVDRELSLSATLYKNRVNNWIRWIPAGEVWRPQNIPEVLAKGAELSLSYKRSLESLALLFKADYSYTNIKMIKGLRNEDPSQGRQLAFQPKHTIRGMVLAEREGLSFFGIVSYTGERTTLDIFDILKPYTLIDVGVEYRGEAAGQKFTLNCALNNIMNTEYQNVKFYAMAGRNWNLSLRIFF